MSELDMCMNQMSFNKMHYEAIKYAREKDDEEAAAQMSSSPFMYTMYLYFIIHMICLFLGIILAIQQPREHRVIHLTLAIVFAPAYIFAYFIGMLGNNGRVDNNQPGSKVSTNT